MFHLEFFGITYQWGDTLTEKGRHALLLALPNSNSIWLSTCANKKRQDCIMGDCKIRISEGFGPTFSPDGPMLWPKGHWLEHPCPHSWGKHMTEWGPDANLQTNATTIKIANYIHQEHRWNADQNDAWQGARGPMNFRARRYRKIKKRQTRRRPNPNRRRPKASLSNSGSKSRSGVSKGSSSGSKTVPSGRVSPISKGSDFDLGLNRTYNKTHNDFRFACLLDRENREKVESLKVELTQEDCPWVPSYHNTVSRLVVDRVNLDQRQAASQHPKARAEVDRALVTVKDRPIESIVVTGQGGGVDQWIKNKEMIGWAAKLNHPQGGMPHPPRADSVRQRHPRNTRAIPDRGQCHVPKRKMRRKGRLHRNGSGAAGCIASPSPRPSPFSLLASYSERLLVRSRMIADWMMTGKLLTLMMRLGFS